MVYYLATDEYLPLNCFLDGEDSDKTILCKVYRSNGSLFGQASLTHMSNGYYHNPTAIKMPRNELGLVAIYEIFDDALMTKKSMVYTTVVDQFLPSTDVIPASQGLDASRELIGTIELL